MSEEEGGERTEVRYRWEGKRVWREREERGGRRGGVCVKATGSQQLLLTANSQTAANHTKQLHKRHPALQQSPEQDSEKKKVMLLLCRRSETWTTLKTTLIQFKRIHQGASDTRYVSRKRRCSAATSPEKLCRSCWADQSRVRINKHVGQLKPSFDAAQTELQPDSGSGMLHRWAPLYLCQCTREAEPLLRWMCHLVFLRWMIYIREKHANIVCRGRTRSLSWFDLISHVAALVDLSQKLASETPQRQKTLHMHRKQSNFSYRENKHNPDWPKCACWMRLKQSRVDGQESRAAATTTLISHCLCFPRFWPSVLKKRSKINESGDTRYTSSLIIE